MFKWAEEKHPKRIHSWRTDLLLISWCDGTNYFNLCSRDSILYPPPVALLYWLPHLHVISFLLYSQPCGPERTLHLIREYYLTLGGQHSSTSQGFCQQCISFYGCPKSISVVPAAPQGTLCDPCHFRKAHTHSISFKVFLYSVSADMNSFFHVLVSVLLTQCLSVFP